MDKEQYSAESPHPNHAETHLKDLPPWMTTQEAAEYSGYDIEHVRRLARQGKIGAVKKGRDWWIDEILPGELGVGVSGRVAVRWKRNASGW
jgi:excisionase family DNA binding protein